MVSNVNHFPNCAKTPKPLQSFAKSSQILPTMLAFRPCWWLVAKTKEHFVISDLCYPRHSANHSSNNALLLAGMLCQLMCVWSVTSHSVGIGLCCNLIQLSEQLVFYVINDIVIASITLYQKSLNVEKASTVSMLYFLIVC